MKKLQLPMPSPKQQQFIADNHKFLAFGGSRGGGKSFAVREKAIYSAYKYPGITQLIIRKTYPELQSNHIDPLREMLHCGAPDAFARYNDQKKEITFPNGSRIIFRYCDTDKDVIRFQGLECDILYVDEATHQPEERIVKLNACVRGVNNFPKQIRYTCNPGGEGHQWVKRLFIDRHFNEGENPDDYAFIQSSVYDNKALIYTQPDYISQLESLPPHLKDMWLYGRWDLYEGQFFEDFRMEPDVMAAHEHGVDEDAATLKQQRRWTHVIKPFDISSGECRHWNLVRSYDFGYGKPFSVAWWAVDHEGILYRVMELYGCTKTPNEGLRWSPDKQFEEIARIEREHPWLRGRHIEGVADPAIWESSSGISIAETAIKYGVYFQKGDHDRIPGWMQCHYRLQFDEDGYPRMYVFENCKAFLRTIPLMIYDEHKPEDLDTDLEDHVCDEWRYMCMSRPITPLRPVEQKTYLSDPLNQLRSK